MKEAFEKIIERLEEEREWSSTHGKDVKFREGRLSGLRTGIRIVKEVAEEYSHRNCMHCKHESLPITDEHCKYCKHQFNDDNFEPKGEK